MFEIWSTRCLALFPSDSGNLLTKAPDFSDSLVLLKPFPLDVDAASVVGKAVIDGSGVTEVSLRFETFEEKEMLGSDEATALDLASISK